ncbi:MAG: hypothetical protein HQL48_08655 [Gammaproteobacteria bacterium]|nr:hypothetical protein [Gammaproteobacteria bacterium]
METKQLTNGQIVRIRILHEVMGAKWSSDLKQTIDNFDLDMAPEQELQFNERAVATYLVAMNTLQLTTEASNECWSAVIDLLLRDRIQDKRNMHLTEEMRHKITEVFRSDFTS